MDSPAPSFKNAKENNNTNTKDGIWYGRGDQTSLYEDNSHSCLYLHCIHSLIFILQLRLRKMELGDRSLSKAMI